MDKKRKSDEGRTPTRELIISCSRALLEFENRELKIINPDSDLLRLSSSDFPTKEEFNE